MRHLVWRIRLVYIFSQLIWKATEIETAWKEIQQNEHDFHYAFNCRPNDETQSQYLYKKGLADGVKWCISRFS